jgi:hypothetical protein
MRPILGDAPAGTMTRGQAHTPFAQAMGYVAFFLPIRSSEER